MKVHLKKQRSFLRNIFDKKMKCLQFQKNTVFLTLQFSRCTTYGNYLLQASGSDHTGAHHIVASLSQPKHPMHRRPADPSGEQPALVLEPLYQFLPLAGTSPYSSAPFTSRHQVLEDCTTQTQHF